MPKLLSRSKHEEFESSSALQIRDQNERRAENARKMEHCEIWFLQHCSQLQYCSQLQHCSSCSPYSPAFHAFVVFVAIFLVSSHLVLVIVKCFCCFWYFHLSWWLYKPFVYTVKRDVLAVNKIRAPVLPFFFFSLIFSPFLSYQTLL